MAQMRTAVLIPMAALMLASACTFDHGELRWGDASTASVEASLGGRDLSVYDNGNVGKDAPITLTDVPQKNVGGDGAGGLVGLDGSARDVALDISMHMSADLLPVQVDAPYASSVEAGVADGGDGAGYTSSGVTVYLGKNPCPNASLSGWDPATGKCYTGSSGTCNLVPPDAQTAAFNESHGGVVSLVPVCGATYAPGKVLIWSSTNPRFHYLADSSGGNVCLPNVTSYVVPYC